VDLIVADVSAPERPGLGLYRWLVERRSPLAHSFVFVAAGDQLFPSLLAETKLIVLEKPVARSELLKAIEDTLVNQAASASSAR
jgi:DNA-binding NarL/FixJ family response regulator